MAQYSDDPFDAASVPDAGGGASPPEEHPGRGQAALGMPPRRSPRSAEERANEALLRRVPPHSIPAERAVLAGSLLHEDAMNNLADMLVPDDFYLPAHQILFRGLVELFRKNAPLNIVALAEHLRNLNQLEDAGGSVYLSELTQLVVEAASAEYFAGVVRAKAMQRNLINACAEIISNSYDTTRDVAELLDSSERAVFEIAQRTAGKGFATAGSIVSDVFSRLTDMAKSHEVITGVTTGYADLDKATSGLQPSDLIIVAARPSMGKTAFAMCMAMNAAIKQGKKVAVFSLEMSKEQLMMRMLAVYARVDVALLRRPATLRESDWSNIMYAADVLRQAPIFIDDTAGLSTLELRARTRRLKAEHGVDMVVVDYLQLMQAGRRIDSRELEISEISRSLKALAKELNIPVVALSQLNRKVEERSDKRPILSDLRESGAIEQDADVIMFIFREDAYKKVEDRPAEGKAEIIIGKQRNGPVTTVNLTYISRYTTFADRAYIPDPSETGV